MKFNPLIAIPSPRNIPKAKAALDTIDENVDRLWVKFYKEDKAYAIMQSYFAMHQEYTHLVLCPDDLMVYTQHFEALADTVRSDPDLYQVLGGICNFDIVSGNEYRMCVTITFPPCNPRRHLTGHGYTFMNLNDRHKPTPKGVQRVSFNGFPCMFIARSVLERLTLRTDWEFNLQFRLPGSSVDTVFCWEAYQNKIDLYADFDVRMLHLRGWEDPCMKVLTGIEEPRLYLQHKGGEMEEIHYDVQQIVPKVSK